MDKVDEFFLGEWSKRKIIDGSSFDDLFKIGEVPMGWFFQRIFVPHIVPRSLNTFAEIEKGDELNLLRRTKLGSTAIIMKHFFSFNEFRKIRFLRKSSSRCEVSPRGNVLFLSYTNHMLSGGRIFRIQNILNGLMKQSGLQPVVLFADPLSSRDYRKLAGFYALYCHYGKSLDKKAKISASRLHNQWINIKESTKSDLFVNKGRSLWPYLKPAFSFFFSKQFIHFLILYFEMSKKALADGNIKVVVTTSQNGIFDRCIIAAAQEVGVPVLRLQHGIGEEIVPPSKYDKYYKLVFSDDVRQKLIAAGWEENKVIVVGPTIFDGISTYVGQKQRKGRNILITTSPFVETSLLSRKRYFSLMGSLFKAIGRIKGARLIVKLHPVETTNRAIDGYRQIMGEAGVMDGKIVLGSSPRKQYYRLVQWCDVLIHFGSTTALEAMIIDRPTLMINLMDCNFMTGALANKELGVFATYKDDLKAAVEKALLGEDKYRRNSIRYVQRKCGVVDGKAYLNVVKLINDFKEHKLNDSLA